MARDRSYRGADRPFCVMRTPLLCGKKPLRQPNRDMGTWVIAVLLCSQQKAPQPCFDSRKNALCAIIITQPFCGGLPTGPRPKRPALDCVLSPTKSTSLRRAFTTPRLLPDRSRNAVAQRHPGPHQFRGGNPSIGYARRCALKSRSPCCHRMDHSPRTPCYRGMGNASKRSQMLREQAERCRRLARATTDATVTQKLLELAAEFEEQANAEQSRSSCRGSSI